MNTSANCRFHSTAVISHKLSTKHLECSYEICFHKPFRKMENSISFISSVKSSKIKLIPQKMETLVSAWLLLQYVTDHFVNRIQGLLTKCFTLFSAFSISSNWISMLLLKEMSSFKINNNKLLRTWQTLTFDWN